MLIIGLLHVLTTISDFISEFSISELISELSIFLEQLKGCFDDLSIPH